MTTTAGTARATAAPAPGQLTYQNGFSNTFVTEAVAGAVPVGQNSPQRHPLGLYTELLSGTAFTVPRARNRRTWTYRIRPSAAHPPFRRIDDGALRTPPFGDVEPQPNRLRWDPLPVPSAATDFVDGLWTFAGTGSAVGHSGVGVHHYAANRDMTDRVFVDADGELVLVPYRGRIRVHTELGRLDAAPGEIVIVPRGLRFRVDLPDGAAAGYVCENFGAAFELPELGPIGSNGLASARDFRAPVAAPDEDPDRPVQVVQKFGGHLWAADYDHSPLDVVGWHGTLAPFVYDTSAFMTIGTVSFDHPDPSIFTLLTSPTDTPGLANADLVLFPPRWMVAEHTFRPPWYHRNVMSEFMGLVHGVYDAKAEGFLPGGASLHPSWSSHGPDRATYEAASTAELAPVKLDGTLAFMVETRLPLAPTGQALASPALQGDYDAVWNDLRRGFPV